MSTLVGDWGGGPVWRVVNGDHPSNAYFCETDVPGECFLIDPGLDGPVIDAAMIKRGLRPHQVFCTHGHFDHVGSAAYFQKKYGCEVFLHRADERIFKSSNFLLMAIKIRQKIELPEVTYVDDSFSMSISHQQLRFVASPGHTPGSCIVELGRAWFTGDTLYSRGVGLSALPGENVEVLKQSIRNLWRHLTAERTVYPGHGRASDGASIRTENRELLKFLGLMDS